MTAQLALFAPQVLPRETKFQRDLFALAPTAPSFNDDQRDPPRLPRTGAGLLAQAIYCCRDCAHTGPAMASIYIDGWCYCPACASQRMTVATLTWGKKEAWCSGKFWELRLLLQPDGSWRVDGDYSMPNQGGYCGLAGQTFPSRDAALLAALRHRLEDIAKHLAVYCDGDYIPCKHGEDMA